MDTSPRQSPALPQNKRWRIFCPIYREKKNGSKAVSVGSLFQFPPGGRSLAHPLWVILVDFGMSAVCPLGSNLGNAGCPVLLLMASLWT
jgi:hypothetical protein